MAEAGQRDDNVILPNYSAQNNKSPEWKTERLRMLSYICDTVINVMSNEEKEDRAKASIRERYFYSPDTELVDLYEKLGGEWTEELEYYRPEIIYKRK
tara:strand:- start:466 stop:759 length:294 start_codon:yes stop_codon:yes gene_type:complete